MSSREDDSSSESSAPVVIGVVSACVGSCHVRMSEMSSCLLHAATED